MKYLPENDTLLLSPAELNALRARVKVIPNLLSPISQFMQKTESAVDLREFDTLPELQQMEFMDAIKAFCLPEYTILWHETVADQSITRSAAACNSYSPDKWTIISWNPEGVWLRRRTTSELSLGLTRFLAVYPGLKTNNFRLGLSSEAALTAVAALDHCLLAELLAKLEHTNAAASFTLGELQPRFQEADQEDFRWPLLFLQKLVPADLQELAEPERLSSALQELTQAGLLICVEDEDNQPLNHLYLFSEEGEALRQGFLHETSKAGLRVSAISASGEVTHEVFFFLRDPLSLWMFDLTGGGAAIVDLDQIEFQQLIRKILNPDISTGSL